METDQGLSRRGFVGGALALGAAGLAGCAADTPRAAGAAQGRDAEHPRWQIGCYTRPWAAYECRVALDAIAAAGYRYVGLMSAKSPSGLVLTAATPAEEAAQLGQEIQARGLRVTSVYGGDPPGTVTLDQRIAALKQMIDRCAAVGAANLLLGGTSDPKLHEAYYQAIAACCPYAAARGLGLSIKPHGGLNATGPQCRQLIATVGQPNFRLWYDPGNIFYYSDGKLDPAEDAAAVDGLVVGMSVKDYLLPKNVDLTPGTGQVDFARVMQRLGRGGFTGGPLVVETLARGDLAQTLAEAKQARAFVERLVTPGAA